MTTGFKEPVTERLESFGIEISENDDALIALCITKVITYVENEINSSEIPQNLIPFLVDMVCGEFLQIKRTFSPESFPKANVNAAVKRIQVGDTSTEFAVDSSMTAEVWLDSFISAVLSSGK